MTKEESSIRYRVDRGIAMWDDPETGKFHSTAGDARELAKLLDECRADLARVTEERDEARRDLCTDWADGLNGSWSVATNRYGADEAERLFPSTTEKP